METIHFSGGRIRDAFLRGCGVPESFIAQIPALVAAMQPIQFYSCFISYSSKNQEFAECLHADLRAKGVRAGTVLFPVRLDDTVFEVGEGWPALVKDTRRVGDFTRWKEHDPYRKAFDRCSGT